MYSQTTHEIRVSVEVFYIESESNPLENRYFWAYRIKLENQGQKTAQLLTRHWEITDGNGEVSIVDGPGVVGEQPILAPGVSYEYTSGCPLKTSSGIMSGWYTMVGQDGETFAVTIPIFSLDCPDELRTVN